MTFFSKEPVSMKQTIDFHRGVTHDNCHLYSPSSANGCEHPVCSERSLL